MRQLVESLWRLYNEKRSITKAQVEAMKGLTKEEKSYILGNEERASDTKANLPS